MHTVRGTAIARSRWATIVLALLFASVVLIPATALAQVAPTVIDETAPAFGRSAWTYQDLSDPGAAPGGVAPKYEGGYAMFDDTASLLYTASPHGGYDTTTNKCKVCHAVHRAEGAYYLLRADGQDDACDYCHIGGSAHSALAVYDLNAAGKYTPNGHTIGACATIPDSTVYQEAVPVTLSSYDCETGAPLTEDIEVRSYDTEKNSMFRFSRHHSQGSAGTGRSGYLKIGPLALRCMNCHQPHNATEMTWRPTGVNSSWLTGSGQGSGYKLLRLFPSGSTTGAANTYGYYDAGQAIKVPETTLTAGFNYSQDYSSQALYTEYGRTAYQPVWIAQRIGPELGDEHGPGRDANAVNTFTLSVWCADCHNLNIGGWVNTTNPELGFKAHTERTHPAPFVGAFNGPGQCYSCHRNDLPRKNTGDPCSQCHYGSGNYGENRSDPAGSEYVDSDFPHSGEDDDHKLLGSYSVDVAGLRPTTIDETVTVSPDNLDAVCLRCHWVEGKYLAGAPTGDGHDIPAAYTSCTTCHPGADVTEIHAGTPSGCEACHGAPILTNDCGHCHPDKLVAHGYEVAQHTATPGSGLVLIYAAGDHDSAMIGDGEVLVDCDTCHNTELGPIHGDQCSTCHPTPVDGLGSWTGSCQQGGCHATYHEDSWSAHWAVESQCTQCHETPGWTVPASNCANCHAQYSPGDSTPPVTTSDALASYIGAASIGFSITDGGLIGVGTTYWRIDGGPTNVGSRATVTAAGPHTLEFWSMDQAGNVESPPKTASFTITADSTPPVTTSNTQPTYTGNANITLTATDNGTAGVQATYYQIDGGPTQTGTSVFVPRVGSGSQPHTLTFWSVDYSGNVESATTENFTIVGLGTIRLVWWDADVNPSHAPGANEWANWTIRAGGSSGPIVATGSGTGPWDGVDDEVVPVSATPYWVYTYYQYWDPDQGFFEQDSTIFPNVVVDTPGQVVTVHY